MPESSRYFLDTSSVAYTQVIRDGQEEYPCRCGVTHRGPYAIYDWMHHNCFHEAPLVRLGCPIHDPTIVPKCGLCQQLICMDCGNGFALEA